MKDILHSALSSANVPSRLEPTGLDQMVSILIESPWYHGRIELLVWDAICVDTFVTSHLSMTASELCATANQAEQNKIKKYNYLTFHAYLPSHLLPLKQLECRSISFLSDLGHRIANTTGDKSSLAYLLQRFSVAIQRGNAASLNYKTKTKTCYVTSKTFFYGA